MLLSCFLASCAAPPIPLFPSSAVARTERPAREVEVCRLIQEADVRAMSLGVDEATSAPWRYAVGSIAVKHPSGLVIIDPAFGSSLVSDLARAGWLVTGLMGTERTKKPLVAVMREAGLEPADVRVALLTHAHWDHTGGLADLANARVLVSRGELEWMKPFRATTDHGTMPHTLKRVKRQLYSFEFSGPAVDGFSSSFDVYGDGSIVGVPLPGHTPGSTGWLVRGPGGVTWLFSGDSSLTWRGVEKPAHKSIRLYDEDLDALSQTLGKLHAFVKYRPDVQVIPAHDGAALEKIPACSAIKSAGP
jgi:glyoxylase-like metal-dependent hydrolase (beta-lactamase superfamily II)